jgi:enoyl-CoA hydratase/carnithine racemase
MTAEIVTTLDDRLEGRVARITVSNPAKLNVIGAGAMRALAGALHVLGADPDLRVVVLAGDGERAFIGGADITEMAALDRHGALEFITALHAACQAIRTLPVPVVVRLQGWTIGAGLEIAAACDLRVAAQGALFAMPDLRMGIPGVIEAARLPLLIGWGRARRLLLTGEPIDAATALAWGLVEEVVLPEELTRAVGRVVGDLLAGAPQAVRRQKALLREWEESFVTETVSRALGAFAASWDSGEPHTRMQAFLAARAAQRPMP